VIFDSYTVEVFPDKPRERKNCALSFDLSFPSGYSCSLGTVNYRGAASLDKGVKGYLTATYFFSGVRTQTSLTTSFRGPVQEKDYIVSDAFSLQSAVRSPCGAQAPLTLNTAIQLDAGKSKGRGELSTDSSKALLDVFPLVPSLLKFLLEKILTHVFRQLTAGYVRRTG
jgi:uncharacterized protein DUF4360